MKMCNALCRFGFNVTLLAGMKPEYQNVNIFEYYGIENNFSITRKKTGCYRGASFLLSLRYYRILKDLAKSTDDIVFYGRDVLALYFLAQSGRNVIYETHDILRKGPRSWAEEKLMRTSNLHRIVFISNELKKVYLKKYGKFLANKNMVIAPDASDEQPNFTETLDLHGQADFNICYIGSFYKGRGLRLILDIAESVPEAGFHLFGGTANHVDKLKRKSLKNVYFYGFIPPAQTYKIRNAADILLMPYQKEVRVAQNTSETSQWMSPVKLFEYMSSRKPIISSNHKVLQEVLKHNHNCLLCEPDDVGQWLQAIHQLKENRQLYDRISEEAYRDFLDRYTWDKRIKHVLFEN
jgi:glycosyltransferase involved in cell wall biosynthesis